MPLISNHNADIPAAASLARVLAIGIDSQLQVAGLHRGFLALLQPGDMESRLAPVHSVRPADGDIKPLSL
jgi:hypothetical protein